MRALAFSGGKDSLACLHLLKETLDCAIYVDTGYAYPETRKLVEYAAALVPMHIVHSNREAQNETEGIPSELLPVDWTRYGHATTGKKSVLIQSYQLCCFENIARPLLDKAKALGVTELVYGQRNEESHKASSRDGDMVEGIRRLHPIEDWTTEQVYAFLADRMTIPEHLHIKHSSLDCYDCTAFRAQSADRIEYTRRVHPDFHAQYEKRAMILKTIINQAIEAG